MIFASHCSWRAHLPPLHLPPLFRNAPQLEMLQKRLENANFTIFAWIGKFRWICKIFRLTDLPKWRISQPFFTYRLVYKLHHFFDSKFIIIQNGSPRRTDFEVPLPLPTGPGFPCCGEIFRYSTWNLSSLAGNGPFRDEFTADDLEEDSIRG